jgi:predicted phosphodiesterase
VSPIKILIAGDTHGEAKNVKHKIFAAKTVGGVERIVILGDFGLWWGHDAIKYIEEINDSAKANNIQIFAIPGNHENYKWWNSIVENAPAHAHGWAYAASNVLLSPRVHDFYWGGRQFVVAGGAVSIDRQWREEYRRKKGKRIWSPDEQLTDEEVDKLLSLRFANDYMQVDYLLTHDCSDRTPWGGRLKPDIESLMHRKKIDKVLAGIKPNMHFHGHMHEKYDWMNPVYPDYGPDTHWVQTYGLECNNDLESWGILDLDSNEFTWASEFEFRIKSNIF